MDTHIDSERISYAKTASYGFGMGQTEARRKIGELSEQELEDLRAQLADDASLALAQAQNRSIPFGDDVAELIAKGQVEQQDNLELIYRSCFDIAFSAYLVEALNTTTAYVADPDATASGASVEGARMA